MAKRKVCLDAGHYGKYNRSPAVKTYYESEMNWKLHLLLKAALEQYDIEVITTRKEQDKDLSLKARGMAARGCDLFLSIHSNAVGNNGVDETVDHASAYCQVDDEALLLDDTSRKLGVRLAAKVAEVMALESGWKMSTRISDNDKDGDGVLDDNYYGVLNGARLVGVPGIILEHSFHTNTRATLWLMEESNLQKLAEAEAAIIAEWLGLTEMSVWDKIEREVVYMPPTLIRGRMNSGEVLAVQAKLKALGYDLGNTGFEGLDGDFGPNTEKAVKAFQKAQGLTADGIVGVQTWRALLEKMK